MGVQKEQAVARREGPKKSGSGVDWSKVPGVATGVGTSWADCNPDLMCALVDAATRRGMAISFSATANGQAVSVTLLDGSARPKWYANNAEELERQLQFVLSLVTAG